MNDSKTRSRRRTVYLVDDHPLVRKGLAALIQGEEDLEICGVAEGASEAMAEIQRIKPDLVIVDLSLKSGNGIELIKHIHAVLPELRILVFSFHNESIYAERVIQAGALGYLSKEASTGDLLDAIHQVLEGRLVLSAEMTERLLKRKLRGESTASGDAITQLSDRELEVFELLGEGLSTRQIAQRLGLSIKTIDSHRDNIKQKLDVKNANELIQRAVHWVMEKNETPKATDEPG
jgi:DNA-binding NarL/FixJ family response regulator